MLCPIPICILSPSLFPIYSEPILLIFFLLVTSPSFFLSSNSLHLLVSPLNPFNPSLLLFFLVFRFHFFPPSYTFYSSHISAVPSTHSSLLYTAPHFTPHPQSSCLPSIHTVIYTVTDAALAPSLSTVSPLRLQNSII